MTEECWCTMIDKEILLKKRIELNHNVNRLGSDKWKEFYQKSPWCNIQLTDKQNLEFHDYRIISKYLWRNEKYQDSIIWYLKYLKEKLGC